MSDHIQDFSRKRINLRDPVNLISEEFHSICYFLRIRRKYFHNVSPDPECAPFEIHIISVILNLDQLLQHLISVLYHSGAQRDYHFFIIDRRTQSVNAGYAGHNDHVIALGQRCCRRMTEFINLIVDCGILGNVSV